MKMYVLIFAFLVPGGVLSAQSLAVEDVSVKRVKRQVEARFELREVPAGMRKRQKLVLHPYLYSGTDTLWLAPAQVYGSIRYKRERQEAALHGNRRWGLVANEAMCRQGTLRYRDTGRYERWMKRASLGVVYCFEGCGCECWGGDVLLLGDVPLYTQPVPVLAEVKPEPKHFEVLEARKRWEFKEGIRVYFPTSNSVLQLKHKGNKEALDEIIASIRKIGGGERLRLQGVEITGYASPEGAFSLNARLGGERAEALKAYLQQAVPELKDKDFRLNNGKEDWEGLRAMVAASGMEHRDEVLAILEGGEDVRGRKLALMDLAGGEPYRYMVKEFFPELRNACYISVFYDVLGDKAADAVNGANGLIRAGRYGEALARLLEYQDDVRAFNSIGVCYMMLEDEEEAAVWFGRAIQAGCLESERNLEQIQ